MVRELLSQIRFTSTSGAYYLALMAALMIPSICGALESSNCEDTGPRYVAWLNRWVASTYSVGPKR
jgi:hypothetical protein